MSTLNKKDVSDIAAICAALSAEAYPNTRVSVSSVITRLTAWLESHDMTTINWQTSKFLIDIADKRDEILRVDRRKRGLEV